MSNFNQVTPLPRRSNVDGGPETRVCDSMRNNPRNQMQCEASVVTRSSFSLLRHTFDNWDSNPESFVSFTVLILPHVCRQTYQRR